MVLKPGVNELESVRVRRDNLSDLLFGKVCAVSVTGQRDRWIHACANRWWETYFGLSGSLTSWSASIRAFSLWDFSARWRSIVVAWGGWPRFSQFSGTASHACFTLILSQCGARGVARPPRSVAARMERKESGRQRMVAGDRRDDIDESKRLRRPGGPVD